MRDGPEPREGAIIQPNQVLTFDRYRLDLPNEQLWRGKLAIALTSQTFAVLRYLVEHAGQVVTKAGLFEALWPDTVVSDGALTFCIVELRKALGDNAKRPQFIETVHRRGYRFIAPLSPLPGQSMVPPKMDHRPRGGKERKVALSYEYLGEQEVKNIAEPVRVYRVRWEAEGGAAPTSVPLSPGGGREEDHQHSHGNTHKTKIGLLSPAPSAHSLNQTTGDWHRSTRAAKHVGINSVV